MDMIGKVLSVIGPRVVVSAPVARNSLRQQVDIGRVAETPVLFIPRCLTNESQLFQSFDRRVGFRESCVQGLANPLHRKSEHHWRQASTMPLSVCVASSVSV